jgi:glycerol-3-phosphate acyltransferase PlsX
MRIALDAMGGDQAPRETVQGAVLAVRDAELLRMTQGNLEVALVGRREDIERELSRIEKPPLDLLPIVDAREVVEMSEHPVQACKKKRDSSIVRCHAMVKSGEAAAAVSAGNSGATMAAALLICGRIDGVSRPAIVSMVPSLNGVSVLVDAGANADCRAKHLLQFALMGEAYARTALGFKRPRVGLLSIGEEDSKGNELVFESQVLLKQVPFHYIGNVEGRDVVNGHCDVIVCDGFTGNITLKAIEGVGELVLTQIRKELNTNLFTLLGGLLAAPAFRRFKKMVDYKEYGGAPLLGIDGISLISHGKSNAYAIKNAIRAVLRCVKYDLSGAIRESIQQHGLIKETKPESIPPSAS